MLLHGRKKHEKQRGLFDGAFSAHEVCEDAGKNDGHRRRSACRASSGAEKRAKPARPPSSAREPAKITVQEICAHVGINRSSFYLHYRDVYDLLETPEEMARLILQVTAPIPEGLPAPQYDQW